METKTLQLLPYQLKGAFKNPPPQAQTLESRSPAAICPPQRLSRASSCLPALSTETDPSERSERPPRIFLPSSHLVLETKIPILSPLQNRWREDEGMARL